MIHVPVSSLLGIGTDIVEVERVEAALKRFGRRFQERVFRPGELAYSVGREGSMRLAARFAAKEAVLKALGLGMAGGKFSEIEIVRGENGAPTVLLWGKTAEEATQQGVEKILISMSHSSKYAVAQAVALGRGGEK